MQLLCSPASPFSSKARMAIHYLGIEVEEIFVQTATNPQILINNNPLGKIPTLISEQGKAVFDSRSIMSSLDRSSNRKLYPADGSKRSEVEVLEALSDGACECLVSIVYEKRFRPAEMLFQPWIDRQWDKVDRGLAKLSKRLPKPDDPLFASDFALAALVGYLEFRFAGQWEDKHGALLSWSATFEEAFPAYVKLKPQT